ncbi:single-stranded DNA-binding protein [Campylobacter sp. MIT 97-5078]|uniref:single-stranded DNA-binding protein n=1 Tax=Campylobacter sp. MIT 97-5078 TaxID=1548153 RepID=UPI00068FA6F2|nr:single-stranded DNA-binding protein [Campylobacter sp. MIT 97-5078]TQR25583.1 single-stranded DNA-binding protein [Campylobacter sp. MIT 97-5078]
MNKVALFGFLGKDFEMSSTQSGKAVAKGSLAITKRWVNAKGNKEEHTDWIPLTLFDKSAENANKFFKKGDRFLCEGEINTNKYIDEKTGEEKFGFSVIVRNFHFVKNKDENNITQSTNNTPALTDDTASIQTDLKENEMPSSEEVAKFAINKDDMPFG